jgi:DNA-binding winged helix-turn-helix (wHTH) protein
MTSDPGAHTRERAVELKALRFGAFEMDVRAGELRRSGHLVRLQPQPFKVLSLLASRPGDVVTREEVQAEVWPAGTFVDFEQSLNFCIRQIRAALGDNALAPRYVETLPRRGYRWVGGSVERVLAAPEPREWPRAVALEPRGTAPEGEADGAAAPLQEPAPAVAAGSQRPGRTARAVIVALALVSTVAAAAAVWEAFRPAAPAPPPSFQRLTFRRGLVNSARFAPDGQVVFGASWDGQAPRVHVTGSDARDLRALEVGGIVVGVSSTGEVAYLNDGVLARAPLAGGPPKVELKDVLAADWTGGGEQFAVVRTVDRHFRLEFPVGKVLAETPRPSRLRLSPDGRYLALAVHPRFDDDRGNVVVYDRSGKLVASSEGWGSLDGIAWPPRGGEVWFTAARTGADSALHALALDGRTRPVLAGMGRLVIHDVAPDGRVLLESATLRSEMRFRREGEAEDRDLSWLDFSAAVALSPDAREVYFYESGQGGGPDYLNFVRRTDGSQAPVRVGTGRACALSRDGQWALAINLRRPDHVDVLPTGPGEARQIRIPGAPVHEIAAFVPGGRRIAVTVRDAADRRSTWLVNDDGSDARRLPLSEGRALVESPFSPDGTRVLMSCGKSGGGACIVPLDGSEPAPVPGAKPEWRPTGWDEKGRLYFRDRSRHFPETLWRVDPASGRAQSIAQLAPRDLAGAQTIASVVVSPGGDAWVYTVLRRLSDLHVVSGVR